MLRAFLALSILLMPLSLESATAQAPGANFKPLLTTGNPPLRRNTPGTASDDHMYVFGGQAGATGTAVLNDLWRFDGTSWSLMTADGAVGSPPARAKACVAWSYLMNRLLVFGGEDAAGNLLGDTWAWDPATNSWADFTPVLGPSPSPRSASAMDQDYATGLMLLFGGEDASGDRDDTWTFDGVSWVEVNLGAGTTAPKARHDHAVCGRSDMGDTIMTQGYAAVGGYQKSTFSWDGTTWTEITQGFTPSGSVGMDATYDRFRRRMILTGGGDVSYIGDIFELKSEDGFYDPHFTDPAIGKVREYAMAYVPNLGKSYKFGGTSDQPTTPGDWTYEYQTDLPSSWTKSGTGCMGISGVLDLTAGDLPWLGLPTTATLSGADGAEIAVMLVGFDDTSWLGSPLPLDLGPLFGSPGCSLYLAPYDPLMQVLGTGPSDLVFSAPVPSSATFAGVDFFIQGATFGILTGSVATSPMLKGTIGMK